MNYYIEDSSNNPEYKKLHIFITTKQHLEFKDVSILSFCYIETECKSNDKQEFIFKWHFEYYLLFENNLIYQYANLIESEKELVLNLTNPKFSTFIKGILKLKRLEYENS